MQGIDEMWQITETWFGVKLKILSRVWPAIYVVTSWSLKLQVAGSNSNEFIEIILRENSNDKGTKLKL